jgi:hypothetical protein
MKDSKDFDVNQFVEVGTPIESTVATGNTQPSKPTAPTPSSEQTVKPLQAVSTSPSEQSVPPQQVERPQRTAPAQPPESTQPTQMTSRTSTRQRRASLDEYREMFMTVPKIIDRQPVFVSRETRDRIDSVVRRLGERKMSVSGFLENLARHHLNLYADDLEQWKRL